MYINTNQYVKEYMKNYIWFGRMGGQWAFTHELISIMNYGKILILFGGVGDLGINILYNNQDIDKIVNVDISNIAYDYYSCYLNNDNKIDLYIEDIINNNKKISYMIPNNLIFPRFIKDDARLDILKNKFEFKVYDIFDYLYNNDITEFDFIYIASPTQLPKGLLPDNKTYFYEIYDNVNYTYNEQEDFINLIKLISEKAKKGANIITGIGSGDISLNKYKYVFNKFFDKSDVILYKKFLIPEQNYVFEDWLIVGIN